MHLNEIVNWVDGAFGAEPELPAEDERRALRQLQADAGYQRLLQDQVNRQIIRDYLVNAVMLNVITPGGLAAFAIQMSTEDGRAALALHMLMSSVEEAMDLPRAAGQVELLTPLGPARPDRGHIKLVPS